jgi:hypothetical protein
MWWFTTPLILKLYCDMNNFTLSDVNAHVHIISNTLHIVLFPLRKTQYYSYIILSLSGFECFFIYKLFNFKEHKYTKFIIYIWGLFSIISLIEILNLFTIHDIQICYLLSDMIAKLTTLLIVNDNEEQIYYVRNNVDLQSISLFSLLNKTIKNFENTSNITPKCKACIQIITNKINI